MQTVTLAYRDDDRTPLIFAIREVAKRHYDLHVRVVQITDEEAFEAALFNRSCHVILEHLEYLYDEAARGKKITIFCAPSKGAGLHLVVPQHVVDVSALKGKVVAVRAQGQPHAVTLWLRMMGLEKYVATMVIDDKEIGRWGQWKKVVSGDCIATFMSPLYVPQPLAAGLKILPVPEIPIVGHFAQACLSEFGRNRSELLSTYVKSVLHALVWLIVHRREAFVQLAPELEASMRLGDNTELKRRFDSVVSGLKLRPYPTPEAIANSHDIAALEYPAANGLNPLSLWDLHWVKELDDQGFIDNLIEWE